MDMRELGWDERWEGEMEALGDAGLAAGRVLVEHRGMFRIATSAGEFAAEVAGRLRHAAQWSDLPAVGDFVAARLPQGDGPAIIQAVLARRTAFVRRAAGEKTESQVVAANVDMVFIMSALDRDFSFRRLERYLTLAWESGAEPVVILNKADLCEDTPLRMAEAEGIAVGVRVLATSALTGDGIEAVKQLLRPGRTVGVLGSSGVGKSTLINALLGAEVQATREVRSWDDRGRHTTSHRQLFLLPQGGMIIDTPGMRELQLWEAEKGLGTTFPEIEALAAGCRFRDCEHNGEPGCAVIAAVERGELGADRLASYEKLLRELRYTESRRDERAMLERKRTDKIANKAMKQFKIRD